MANTSASEAQLAAAFLAEHADEDPKGTEEDISVLNDSLAQKINTQFKGQPIVITTILKGAVYFCVDLTRRLTIPYSLYFLEASSYHDSQTQQEEVELLSKIVPKKFEGKKVLLIDELYDNGTTLAKVKAKLLSTPGLTITEKDVFTCTLFQKEKKVTYPNPDLVGYARLPDLWVVGYGLDDAQEKRGWKHLFAIPKVEGVPPVDDDKIFVDDAAHQAVRNRIKNDVAAIKAKNSAA